MKTRKTVEARWSEFTQTPVGQELDAEIKRLLSALVWATLPDPYSTPTPPADYAGMLSDEIARVRKRQTEEFTRWSRQQ